MSRVFGMLLLAGWVVMALLDTVVGREQKSDFAADRQGGAQPAKAKPVVIDGKRAMKYLTAICDIGPRISATAGMKKQQELIQKHFEDLGAKVKMQPFKATQISRPGAVDMANMIVSWNPEKEKRVILCSHYDTRPIADQEIDQRNWHKAFVSANDGGSGVALLMELGHHMKDMKIAVGVDFVFFDGEEFIFNSKRDKYFFGSEHFAKEWRKSKQRPNYLGAILLDMIAGHGARFPAEGTSLRRARPLVDEVWAIAAELKCTAFENRRGDEVLDDHIALLNAGIPAIDIIDLTYKHWHKLSDTPDNCSAESMDQVALVLSVWLQRAH